MTCVVRYKFGIVSAMTTAVLELGQRELQVLRSLSRNERGLPNPGSPPLPFEEYNRAVLTLCTLGLCGADVRLIRDDPEHPAVREVERLWLTSNGRDYVRGL